jgi:hypothetical protein
VLLVADFHTAQIRQPGSRGLATGVAGWQLGQGKRSGVGGLGKATPLFWWHTARLLVSSPGTLVVQPPVSFAEHSFVPDLAVAYSRRPRLLTFASGGGRERPRTAS